MVRTRGMTLGVGWFDSSTDNIRQGTAMFPVRGELPISMDLMRRESDQLSVARFRVGTWETQVTFDRRTQCWVGNITVEGYPMRVTIDRNQRVEFDDV